MVQGVELSAPGKKRAGVFASPFVRIVGKINGPWVLSVLSAELREDDCLAGSQADAPLVPGSLSAALGRDA